MRPGLRSWSTCPQAPCPSGVLKEAELVVVRVEGTRHLYELNPSGTDAARDYLDSFWDTSSSRFTAQSRCR